jgi:thiol-disulfide isomerase/thioredoxin
MENTMENHEHKTHGAPKAKKPLDVWMIVSVVLLVVSLGLGYVVFSTGAYKKIGKSGNEINSQVAANNALKYIQDTYSKDITLNKVFEGQTCFYKIGLNYNNQVVNSFVSVDGKSLFPADPIDISKVSATVSTDKVAGNFEKTTETSVCTENGKPIIYFFGTSTCPHCIWEKPVIRAVAASFGTSIVFKEEISTNGSAFADASVFEKYSPTGGVPVLVLGCKYARVGSGESDGEATEKANLTKLICELTGNQPSSVCGK